MANTAAEGVRKIWVDVKLTWAEGGSKAIGLEWKRRKLASLTGDDRVSVING